MSNQIYQDVIAHSASPAILGYLADRTESRRFPLLLGLLLLTGATVMLCVGTSVHTFLIGRILQGMSAAVVWAAGLALLADNVERGEQGQYLGYTTMAMNAGVLLGPLLGGIVYDKGGYYAVYEIAFALIGLDILLRLVVIEKRTARKYLASTEDPCSDPLLSQPALNDDEERRSLYSTGNVTDAESEPPTISTNPRSVWQRRLPPFLWLLGSRRLLVAMLGAMVWGILVTSFDAVSFTFTQFHGKIVSPPLNIAISHYYLYCYSYVLALCLVTSELCARFFPCS